MKCRKCAAQIPDNSVRCPNCGIKVSMHCPNCGTSNVFGNKFCSECGFALLKKCPVCGAVNIYSADKCRKCDYSFSQTEVKISEAQINKTLSDKDADVQNDVEIKQQLDKPVEDISAEEVVEAFSEVYSDNQNAVLSINQENSDTSEMNSSEEQKSEVQIENITEEKKIENIENTKIDNPVEVSEFIETDEIKPLEEDIDINNEEEYDDDESEIINTEYVQESDSIGFQSDIVEKVTTSLKTSITKHIIAIQGAEGCGKSAVLKQTADLLKNDGFLFLYGSCTPLLQITSFGFFQDAFLRIMGFPTYTKTTEAFFKDFKKSEFYGMFNFLNSDELALFLNIFYPVQKDKFENILINRQVMFSILEKVIKSFSLNTNLVIAIDNFELLDGASYDFIVYMLNKGYFNDRVKLLTAYQENKKIQNYFDIAGVDENIFEMINMDKLTPEEMINSVKHSLSIDVKGIIPKEYLDSIIEKSNGNALKFEQETALLFNTGYISVVGNNIVINEENKPVGDIETFEELIKLRLNSLAPAVKNVLFTAAIMGFRFACGILISAVNLPVDKANKILDYLRQELFITEVDDYTFEFKSLELWKIIYKQAQNDLLYKENSQRLYNALKPLFLSSNLQKLISCTEALSKNEEFIIWQETASICAKLGDTNLYVIAQKQCLKLIEQQNVQDSEEIRAIIYEQLGKLLYKKSPQEAISYLSNILDDRIKAEDVKKVIDLSSYFVNSCYLSGNYFGAAEAVDAAVTVACTNQNEVSALDIALMKTRKLKALLNIGNSEQIINLINEDIILEIENVLYSSHVESDFKNLLTETWLNTKVILAKAYILQGNNMAFEVIDELNDFENKHKYNLEYYNLQIDLLKGFANTVCGDIEKSNDILKNIYERTKNSFISPELLCEWNLNSIINRILLNDKESIKSDLFELAAFSNNINEHFIKNILKLILGYIIRDEGDFKKSYEIFNEEITYFAKEKVAIGALLAWLFIIQSNISSGDDDSALNTASKALEIAQSAKINNNFFTVYFEKYIAEIYMRKGDYTAAKMYFEKAITLAKQYNLRYQLAQLYIAFGFCLETDMKNSNEYSEDNISLIAQLYEKALNCSDEIKINHIREKALRAKSDFNNFCRLNLHK